MSESTSTPDPRPGPSRPSLSLVVERPVSSMYLVKDCKCNIKTAGQSIPLSSTVLKLKEFRSDSLGLEGEHQRGPSHFAAAVAAYVRGLKAEKGNSVSSALLTLKLHDQGVGTRGRNCTFVIEMDAQFVNKMQSLLPSPYLEIKGKTEALPLENIAGLDFPPTFTAQFGKFIELKGETKLSQCISDSIPRSSLVQMGLGANLDFSLLLSIVVGWEPPKELDGGTTALKLSTDSFLQSLFKNESSKDVTIVLESGAEVKCHRLIFSAHSPVLAAMLSPDNGMREGQTGRMELGEISEEGVRQLLRYLYCMEVDTTKLSCKVVVELFKTAHKYELTHLENSMKGQLLRMGKEWYESDVVVELYYHVRNLKEFESLRDHSLMVMVNMPKEVRSCERFKELEQKDAMELVWKLVETPKTKTKTEHVLQPIVPALRGMIDQFKSQFSQFR